MAEVEGELRDTFAAAGVTGFLHAGLAPAACEEIRRIMALQVWPHRLTSGFPDDDVRVSSKTGTLSHVRNEVGVVEYPDAVIGTAGRIAVEHLRATP